MLRLDFTSAYDGKMTVALGFFDCVHLGHREILAETVSRARETGAIPAVFTFRTAKRQGEPLAISYGDRLSIFESLGIEAVIFADFDEAFASTPSQEFLSLFLHRFRVERFVCGEDYRFGRGAEGNAAFLEKFCAEHGVLFSKMPLLGEHGQKISSTEIRDLLRIGDFPALNALLGSEFFRTGKVVEGFGKGREIGIRTANVDFGELCPIADGVYKTRAGIGETSYPAATFVGTAVTFGRVKKTVECHVIGFDGDLYGEKLRIFFERKLRDNRRFDSPVDLVAQIKRDVTECKED